MMGLVLFCKYAHFDQLFLNRNNPKYHLHKISTPLHYNPHWAIRRLHIWYMTYNGYSRWWLAATYCPQLLNMELYRHHPKNDLLTDIEHRSSLQQKAKEKRILDLQKIQFFSCDLY